MKTYQLSKLEALTSGSINLKDVHYFVDIAVVNLQINRMDSYCAERKRTVVSNDEAL